MLESRFLQAHTKDSRRRTVRLESTASTTASSTTAVASEATASTATERHFVLVVVRVFVRGSGSGRLSRRDTGELVLFGRSLCATVRRVDWRVQLRYAAWAIAVGWRLRSAMLAPQLEVQEFPRRAPSCMTRGPWRCCKFRCCE